MDFKLYSCPVYNMTSLHPECCFLSWGILTIGAVVVVLTAPYLSDSGGSGIMTPLLFIKLTNQTNSENNTILHTNSAMVNMPEIFKYNITQLYLTSQDYRNWQDLSPDVDLPNYNYFTKIRCPRAVTWYTHKTMHFSLQKSGRC